MSLNGLDDVKVKQAHDAAVAEPGGWFLLKYLSRDEVDVHASGNGGIAEIRTEIAKYEEESPLFGFLRYREKSVLIKYVPEGCSRLVQARVTVHFNAVTEQIVPNDTVIEIAAASELDDTALSAACLLPPDPESEVSPADAQSAGHLQEITEDKVEKKQLDVTGEQPTPEAGERQSRPTTARKSSIASSQGFSHSPDIIPLKLASRRNDLETSPPPPRTSMSRDRSPTRDYEDRRTSSQSVRPEIRSSFSSATRPKVKLGPRPTLDAAGRSHSTTSVDNPRPVSSLPAGLKLFSRSPKKSKDRPSSQATYEEAPIMLFSNPTIPETTEAQDPYLTRPHTSVDRPLTSSGFSVSSAQSAHAPSTMAPKHPTITPEKARLMKALQMRKKQQQTAPPAESLPPLPLEVATMSSQHEDYTQEPAVVAPEMRDSLQMLKDIGKLQSPTHGSDQAEHNDAESDATRTISTPASPVEGQSERGHSTKASSISESTDETIQEPREKEGDDDPAFDHAKVLDGFANSAAVTQDSELLTSEISTSQTSETSTSEIPTSDISTSATAPLDGPEPGSSVILKPVTETAAVIATRDPLSESTSGPHVAVLSKTVVISEASQLSLTEEKAAEQADPDDSGFAETCPVKVTSRDAEAVPAKEEKLEVTGEEYDPFAYRRSISDSEPEPAAVLEEQVAVEPKSPAYIGEYDPFAYVKNADEEKTDEVVKTNDATSIEDAKHPALQQLKTSKEAARPSTPNQPIEEARSSDRKRSVDGGFSSPGKKRKQLEAVQANTVPYPHSRNQSNISSFSQDEDLMAELQSATFQEAKPISVSKSPVKAFFSKASPKTSPKKSPRRSPKKENRFSRNLSNTPFSSSQGLRPQSASRPPSSKSTSAASAYLQRINEANSAPLVSKKVNVGSGISQRIKALQSNLATDAITAVPQPAQNVTPSFYSVRKASIRDRPISMAERPSSRISRYTASPTNDLDSSPEAMKAHERRGSVAERMNAFNGPTALPPAANQKARPETIQVTARIIRDADQPMLSASLTGRHSVDYRPPELKQSPLIIDHQQAIAAVAANEQRETLLERRTSAASKEAKKDRRSSIAVLKDIIDSAAPRVSTSSYRNSSTMTIEPTQYSVSRPESTNSATPIVQDRAASVSATCRPSLTQELQDKETTLSPTQSDTETDSQGKKLSRATRMLRRMSSGISASRQKLSHAISPTVREESEPPTLPPASTLTVKPTTATTTTNSIPTSPYPVTTSDVGDVNVQFPDTLLWKRRSVKLDSAGYLILSQAQGMRASSAYANATKRIHFNEFLCPYMPDVEAMEMPNSVVLEFKDSGRQLQIACEDRGGQMRVLEVLQDAHATWADYSY